MNTQVKIPMKAAWAQFSMKIVYCVLCASSVAMASMQRQTLPAPESQSETKSRSKNQHIFALDLAIKGDVKGSLSVLKSVAATSMDADELDRVMLTMGRVKYQAGDLQGAIDAYQKVRRGGPSWLEALEERAHAQMRLGRTQEALGTLKTVLTPLFKDRILSEPYFLAALAQLRVCDYKSVFKTIELFKTRFRDRVKEWDLAKSSEIAQSRLRETRETIQKLNLVEAEAIQHLYIDENGKRQSGTPPKIGRERDQLTFPMDPEMDSKEVWLDEVDDYRVTVKGCPQIQNVDSHGGGSTTANAHASQEAGKKPRPL